MSKDQKDFTSVKACQYDGTNFLEFLTSLKKHLSSSTSLAIVVQMLTTMKPYNPEDSKLRLQNLYNSYVSMYAMSEFEGAEEDEEWLEMVKEQMVSEGAEISLSRSKSMIGLSRVLDEPQSQSI